ncbi:MAG: amidohydrolase [Saprospiraceae bacterium]|nr:amidohydrolase [Saprospiraceae bacterium]
MKFQTYLITLLLFAAACGETAQKPAAEAGSTAVMYHNGDIITMEGNQPQYAESVVVKDGKILFVGNKAEAMTAAGPGHQMVDLQGKTMLPAFIDGHGHYISSLTVANQVNVYAPPAGPGTDPDAIVAEIKKFIEKNKVPKGELVQCYGYDENVMPKDNQLNTGHLDAAFKDHPVIVGHVSMHGAVLNSVALKKYGYSADYKTPPGGVVVRKPGTNDPWGLIMETAYLPVFAALPKPTAEQEIPWTKAGQMMYAETGITLAHEGATHASDMAVIQRATDAGANIIDVVVHPFMTDLEAIIKDHPLETWGKFNNRLKIGAVKITADGSPQGKTAYFTTPYLTGGPGGEKNWRGEPTMPQADLDKLVKQVYDWNVPLIIHTNGDATIDMFLSAYEKARAGDFSRPWNVTTIHTQFMRKDQIPKFVQYKIRPSFYTLHTFYFASAHKANRGEKQAAYLSPMRDAIDAGLHPTNHTDFYVAPLDQMFMMWSAVNRESREGGVLGPDQRVTPYEALLCQTLWAAEQYDEQDNRGSLKAGKLGDLVILDKNPLKVEPMTIKDIKVLETIKEGKTIYKRM